MRPEITSATEPASARGPMVSTAGPIGSLVVIVCAAATGLAA